MPAIEAVLVIATESHQVSLLSRLRDDGIDIEAAIEEGRTIGHDVADCVPAFIVDGMPDPARFTEVLGNLILSAAQATTKSRRRVALYGEAWPLLWAQGNSQAAIHTEKLANQLLTAYDVDVLCGYCIGSIPDALDNNTFTQICMQHTAVHTK